MAGEVQSTGNSSQQTYRTQIEQPLSRTDSEGYGGDDDGNMEIDEALSDLDIGHMLSGFDGDSKEYKKLKKLTDKIPKALEKCAGDDGILQPDEWEKFLKGKAWGKVLKTYHSTSDYIISEMDMIDHLETSKTDGKCTKDEVKAMITDSVKAADPDFDSSTNKKFKKIEKIIDKFAGDDGIFTAEEYAKLKNKSKYAKFVKEYNIEPFGL